MSEEKDSCKKVAAENPVIGAILETVKSIVYLDVDRDTNHIGGTLDDYHESSDPLSEAEKIALRNNIQEILNTSTFFENRSWALFLDREYDEGNFYWTFDLYVGVEGETHLAFSMLGDDSYRWVLTSEYPHEKLCQECFWPDTEDGFCSGCRLSRREVDNMYASEPNVWRMHRISDEFVASSKERYAFRRRVRKKNGFHF